MDTYHVVLYIHLLSLFVGIGAASVLVVCLFQLRGARELTDAIPWGMVAGKTGRLFPIAILGLFGSGAYMTSDVWSWSSGWIVVGIVALVVLGVQGPVIAERSGKKLEHALRENGPGPLGDHARQHVPLLGSLGDRVQRHRPRARSCLEHDHQARHRDLDRRRGDRLRRRRGPRAPVQQGRGGTTAGRLSSDRLVRAA